MLQMLLKSSHFYSSEKAQVYFESAEQSQMTQDENWQMRVRHFCHFMRAINSNTQKHRQRREVSDARVSRSQVGHDLARNLILTL